ncbi:MAG: hypothetical protein ABIY55_01615, partial [Kofleriaceae bacterium]
MIAIVAVASNTMGCRRRSGASSVVARSGRGEPSSGCAAGSSVDKRIAIGWRELDDERTSRRHVPRSGRGRR